MKLQNLLTTLLIIIFINCGGNDKKRPSYNSSTVSKEAVKKTPAKKVVKKATESGTIDLNNKGIGPVKSLKLDPTINTAMAEEGKLLFKNKCSSCHRVNRKFIGPNPTGILERRSPEWVMNMILNPEEMVKKDPIAKELLIKFNGSPMANQNLTEKESRAVLEYFRTL
ncbi:MULTISPECIES: c-type cytochrome [unclassified Tenacibaculum]|uniref:c-type cytochrome n=1 Tax=unclassified Tenacibaculum TaxID=2635139 RepID=UPI001F3CCB16|nr:MULTISPECIES: cytochrome c [unclassified Tenacibaculum]MCF2875848.1 cytochrome c [Tenacibaculum sp. Cn5-1]MCF2935923.1 cytochrome c [Tenacibaculum sp. Cn5-34]MCG7512484.1 cytochrome c [Tenacibaculum sp. Cn5-46]